MASTRMEKKGRFLNQGSEKNMEENKTDTTDRLLMLPDSVVHHILSYLEDDRKSSVRVGVLSKQWFALTASCPYLYFRRYGSWDSSFRKYVEYTMSRFCEQNISAHTLTIWAEIMNSEEIEFFGRCVDSVLEKGLQMMRIYLSYSTNLPMFRLPNKLLCASSLTHLSLSKCELPSSLMVGAVKLKSLRFLFLSLLPLDEGAIEYLTKGCPLLEVISLFWCYGFKTFCVKRHQNLLKVEINCGMEKLLLERIDIEAPNLSYFSLINKNKAGPSMFLDSCKKLTTFCYRGYPLTRFGEFLSKFQFLENVALNLQSHINNLKLSNHSMKKIRLPSHCDLDEIDLNAPNLLSLEYCERVYFHDLTSLSTEDSSSRGCVMRCETADCYDILWCKKLREFLEKNSIFKVLELVIDREPTDVKELELIPSPAYKLEHVELISPSGITESRVYIALLDVLLWCFRPQSLSLELGDSINKRDVIEFTYEKLFQQEGEGQTNIKFVLFSHFVGEQQFSDLNSLLKALSLCQSNCVITFTKEEGCRMRGRGSHNAHVPSEVKNLEQGAKRKADEIN